MSKGLLSGKCGIVFGALNSDSIAWKAAEAIHEAGGRVVLTNAPIAMRMGGLDELATKIDAPIIPADATSMEDLEKLVQGAMDHFGGKLDFILHSIGMSVNVRKGKHYTELNYDWLQKGWDVSAVSFHKVMQTAWNMDAMNEWGSIFLDGETSLKSFRPKDFISLALTLLDMEPLQGRIYMSPFMKHVPVN